LLRLRIKHRRDENMQRLVVITALDNLMKGAAGQAVQCMNIMFGLDETAGLEFAGLHPI
ncbi:MAG: N-acetyl-gamma-glutamyl-phosphate reductase, partial [Nanoarchaeota archaeon]|nr:N-acetyl-gamma-glutamyl-phosphate reductase [Nanoarchaeota archaeon]